MGAEESKPAERSRSFDSFTKKSSRMFKINTCKVQLLYFETKYLSNNGLIVRMHNPQILLYTVKKYPEVMDNCVHIDPASAVDILNTIIPNIKNNEIAPTPIFT